MINTTRPRRPSYRLPDNAARGVLLEWARLVAPDLRIRHATVEGGRRACAARLTFLGETIEVEAVEGPELPDAEDAIVRRVVWLLQRRIGLTPRLPDGERRRIERAIVAAAAAGRTEEADKLAHELAMSNEGLAPRRSTLPMKFTSFGESIFGRPFLKGNS